ncbi:hypothetical protein ACJIZ3_011601 [Penstemon smallii]|uniref:adenine phosphoribosyltransferase n=1 Tax=Penstemon smallii TaxID=265156 RepID=A0ABD3UJJ5_9LAMI
MFAAENGLKSDPRLKAISDAIRVVPNFPKPGIMFQDITTLVSNHKDMDISVVAGVESRGFIFAPPIALAIGAKFIPLRKPGKLPGSQSGFLKRSWSRISYFYMNVSDCRSNARWCNGPSDSPSYKSLQGSQNLIMRNDSNTLFASNETISYLIYEKILKLLVSIPNKKTLLNLNQLTGTPPASLIQVSYVSYDGSKSITSSPSSITENKV